MKLFDKRIKGLTRILTLLFLVLLIPIQVQGGPFVPIFKNLIIDPMWRLVFILKLRHWITAHATSIARHVGEVITFNPTPTNNPIILALMKTIIKFVQPFYVLAIVFVGFYLLFVSGSPKGRKNAKSAFPKLLVSMLFFSFSPAMLALLLNISETLTKAAFSMTGTEPITEILVNGLYGAHVVLSWLTLPAFGWGANPWSFTLFFAIFFPVVFLALRLIMLTLLEIFFPITILLYSFNYTRHIGRTLLEQTITWTFMQFFWALCLVAFALCVPFKNELVTNPVLTGLQIPVVSAIPFAPYIVSQLFGGGISESISIFSTDMFSLTFGIAAYGFLSALPFMLITILRGYVP